MLLIGDWKIWSFMAVFLDGSLNVVRSAVCELSALQKKTIFLFLHWCKRFSGVADPSGMN